MRRLEATHFQEVVYHVYATRVHANRSTNEKIHVVLFASIFFITGVNVLKMTSGTM